jgi:hypothetical protein
VRHHPEPSTTMIAGLRLHLGLLSMAPLRT